MLHQQVSHRVSALSLFALLATINLLVIVPIMSFVGQAPIVYEQLLPMNNSINLGTIRNSIHLKAATTADLTDQRNAIVVQSEQ